MQNAVNLPKWHTTTEDYTNNGVECVGNDPPAMQFINTIILCQFTWELLVLVTYYYVFAIIGSRRHHDEPGQRCRSMDSLATYNISCTTWRPAIQNIFCIDLCYGKWFCTCTVRALSLDSASASIELMSMNANRVYLHKLQSIQCLQPLFSIRTFLFFIYWIHTFWWNCHQPGRQRSTHRSEYSSMVNRTPMLPAFTLCDLLKIYFAQCAKCKDDKFRPWLWWVGGAGDCSHRLKLEKYKLKFSSVRNSLTVVITFRHHDSKREFINNEVGANRCRLPSTLANK